MMAMAIPAAISSYSIAVAPDSSVKNIKSRRLLSLLLPPRLPTLRVRWINPKYGFMGLCQKGSLLMKTTIEVSDDLYRRAKAEAALRGRKLKDLVAEGLRLVLETPREKPGRLSLDAFMKSACGTVDTGVSALAS